MSKDHRLTMTAIAIMFGMGTVRAFLVDGGLPSRRFLLGASVSAAMLSALSDLRPDLSRWVSYAVITGVMITETIPIADKLKDLDKEQTSAPPGATGAIPASFDQAPDAGAALQPVFLRGAGAPHGTVARRQNTRQRLRTSTA